VSTPRRSGPSSGARCGGSRSALQEREFRLFFTGQLMSLLGDAVTPFALAWAVLDLTGSRGLAGQAAACWFCLRRLSAVVAVADAVREAAGADADEPLWARA
jgi:hypothetical protein